MWGKPTLSRSIEKNIENDKYYQKLLIEKNKY